MVEWGVNMHKGTSPEDLKELFIEYSGEYLCSYTDKTEARALQRIDSVLDLFIDLGYLAVESV